MFCLFDVSAKPVKVTKNIEDNVFNIFKLPVHYDGHKRKLNSSITQDLEMNKVIYPSLCNYPESQICKSVIPVISEYYTNNVPFLKDTQTIIQSMNTKSQYCCPTDADTMVNFLDDLLNDEYFNEKYMYIDLDCISFLNENELFMKVYSILNISSPLIALISPLFVVIIPFFVLRINNVDVTYSAYLKILGELIQTKIMGKVVDMECGLNIEDKLYAIVSVIMYIVHIYQNIQKCIKYYDNVLKIHNHLQNIYDFLLKTIPLMETILQERYNYHSDGYLIFYKQMEEHLSVLGEWKDKIQWIKPYELSFKEVFQLGLLFKTFYSVYSDTTLHNSLYYAIGLQGYVSILNELRVNIEKKIISYASLKPSKKNAKKLKRVKFENIIYPPLIHTENKVTNNVVLDKNITLTGVNASGKTTLLKSIFINTILTQQIGLGTYSSCSFTPYDFLHCYINIIDTSDRYSLFQSECKKCQEIIQSIQENPKKSHFCVFDEIFSGTTPEEAVQCGYGFLSYLQKNTRVKYILTTHFTELCKKLDNEGVENCKMVSSIKDDTLQHTYKIEKGMNELHGSIEILKQLNFPSQVIDTIQS